MLTFNSLRIFSNFALSSCIPNSDIMSKAFLTVISFIWNLKSGPREDMSGKPSFLVKSAKPIKEQNDM